MFAGSSPREESPDDVRIQVDNDTGKASDELDVATEAVSRLSHDQSSRTGGARVAVAEADDLSEQVSYTRHAVSMLAAPQEMPRPRGLFRQNSVLGDSDTKKKTAINEKSTCIATRANNIIVHKTAWSRFTYTVVLLNIILWTPPWLKLLTIRRNQHSDAFAVIYNASIHMDLVVSTFDDPGTTTCRVCDDRKKFTPTGQKVDVRGGVTYPITASIRDFYHAEHVESATRIVLFGSWDWDNWHVVSSPNLFTGLERGNQDVEVCLGAPLEEIDDDEKEDDDKLEDDVAQRNRKKTTFTEGLSTTLTQTQDVDAGGDKVDILVTEESSVWTTIAPTTENERSTDAPTVVDETYLSRCCLGTPGFVYLVACATPFEDAQYADMYNSIPGPGFQDRCISLAGRCGSACGVDTAAPQGEYCDENGNIPLEYLLDKETFHSNKRRRRHYDRSDRFDSWRTKVYHASFIGFVTMTTIGTWISFLAGNGVTKTPPKPSMAEVEDYMAAAGKKKKPLCLVTFSISASEPRMMILRNMCGKLMSWLNQRNAADSIFGGQQNMAASTIFDDDDEDTKDLHLESKTADHAELVDIFQDEGHRVGAYALWDAFVDVVHDADLRFIEVLASKMAHMTAEDDRLSGKDEDDGLLLDDELRSFIKKSHIGVSQDCVDKLELAFSTFYLLNTLGHHAYWRSDSNVNVVGFRDLATQPASAAILKQWAKNLKQARKSTNPFAPNVTPTDVEGIDPSIWNSWWELYSEMGRIQWMKRFDCTKFRLARLHFYRDREENIFRDLVLCYSARANPEDLDYQLAPTVPLRGIRKGVFVRLCEASDEVTKKLFSKYGIRELSRSEARRCHARVLATCRRFGRYYVKVKECTPELLTVIPTDWLANKGHIPDENDNVDDDQDIQVENVSLLNSSYRGEEAVIPLECVAPLRESRGKSGGMNHAMDVLNHYLRHHSSTFQILKEKRKGSNPASQRKSNRVDAHLLFAIFDCRHMAVQGFWDAVIPYFYGYKHVNNPWARELAIDSSVAFVQLPQTFTSLSLDSDIFDMRNEYLFRLANNIRNGVGAITSCGTNAVWNYDIRYQNDPLEHRFNEDTMIEDTASSHDVIIEGRKGIYHFERLVLGARKGTTDYLAAVFRWSRGAVQLFWTTIWYPRYHYTWPWVVLVLHVFPIVAIVAYFQWVRLNECHQTRFTARLGLVPCHLGPAVGLILDPMFLIYGIFMITLAIVSFNWCRIGAYLVMFENITYFFTATSAFFWLAVPIYMCISKNGLPPVFDTQLMTLGGTWLQLHAALLLVHIKQWSPLEDGVKPTNQSLLRSQQMFFINAPLHILAIIFGFQDGLEIILVDKDASRWASFQNMMAMTTVKMWMIGLATSLVVAIGFGVYNAFTNDVSEQEKGERILGVSLCCILLFLLESPIRAMFFFDKVVKEFDKPTRIARLTKAIFGRSQAIRPDLIYGLLWFLLFIYSLQEDKLADSSGILNTKSRCQNSDILSDCHDEDIYKFVKRDVNSI